MHEGEGVEDGEDDEREQVEDGQTQQGTHLGGEHFNTKGTVSKSKVFGLLVGGPAHHAVGVIDAERRGHDEDRSQLALHLHLHHRHVLVHGVLRHPHTPVLEEPGQADDDKLQHQHGDS